MTDSRGTFFRIDLRVIRVTGAKAATFLHGQLTNSIKDLSVGCGNFNLLLDVKGKVHAACYVLNRGEFFDLLAAERDAEVLFSHLAKMAPLSRCDLAPIPSASIHSLDGLPESLVPPEKGAFALSRSGFVIFRSDRLGTPGYDVFSEGVGSADPAEAWLAAGWRDLSAEEADLIRVKNGVPNIGIDATEANLPQEARLDAALHFNKGCYLGQEIIARIHYKGHVNKILALFRAPGDTASRAAEIRDTTGEPVGKVTSRAYDRAENATYLMAYVPAKAPTEARYACEGAALDRLI